MKNTYEATLILDTAGKEDSVDEIIQKIEAHFKKEGCEVTEITKLDRRSLTYTPRKLTTGYFLRVIFAAEPAALPPLRTRFKLDANIFLQYYQKIVKTKASKPRKPVEAAA